MVDVIFSFILLGAVIFFGFLASVLFERTNIPDVLLLVFLGILIGPALKIIDPAPLASFIPFFAALALIIIMFSAGLAFNFYRVALQLYRTAGFALLAYVLTAVAVGAAALAFGWELLPAIFLAVLISGTCSTIANALIPKIRADEDTRISLSVEALATSTISTVLALSLIQFMATNKAVDFSMTLNAIASAFSIAIVTGAVVGIAWLQGLDKLKGRPLAYLLTLGAVFILYGAVEAVKGNGAIATLVFGMVIGNAKEVSGALKWKTAVEPDKIIYRFHEEVTFFVRTFFFVYIGLVFTAQASAASIALSALVLTGIIAARIVASKLVGEKKQPRVLQFFFIPTGLTAVVLAFLPQGAGVTVHNLVQTVLLIVILTNAATALAVYKYNTSVPKRPAAVPQVRAGAPKIIGVRSKT